MWPNFLTGFNGFPFFFPSLGRVNYNTLPTGTGNGERGKRDSGTPGHAFYGRNYVGGFYVNLRQEIPAGTTATLPVLVGTNGDTRPLDGLLRRAGACREPRRSRYLRDSLQQVHERVVPRERRVPSHDDPRPYRGNGTSKKQVTTRAIVQDGSPV